MFSPSFQFLENAIVVMALCNLVLGSGMFFLMQARYARNLARGSRRLTFAHLIGSPWDAQNLEALWAASAADDRVAIEEVLVSETHFATESEMAVFRTAVTNSSIYTHWLERLRTGRAAERARAARLLGYFHDVRGIQALTSALEDSSSKVVLSAVLSLGRLKAPAAIPALVSALATLPRIVPSVTLTAVLAGCSRQEPQSLVSLLKSPDERIRLMGAWAISEIADATVLTDLVGAIRDPYPEVRAKIARAFSRIPAQASVDALKLLAQDSIWYVRYRALHALGELRAPEGAELALSALTDEVREVRYGAAYALRKIQGMKTDILMKLLQSGARLSFDSVISEWDRAGFLYAIVRDLTESDGNKANLGKEFLRVLIANGISSTLESFVLLYPDGEVRWILAHLLLEAPPQDVQGRMVALANDSRCDPRIAELILQGAA